MNNVISFYSTISFQWGKYDCCMFAADVALAKSGKDPAKNHRNKYKTEIGSLRYLKKSGSITKNLDGCFKQITNINLAQRGDIVSFKDHVGVGVVWSNGILSMNPEHGLVKVTDLIDKIWRVERD